MTMKRTHEHEYRPDMRPEWGPGVVCRICGFRVPPNLVHLPVVQERMVPTVPSKEMP